MEGYPYNTMLRVLRRVSYEACDTSLDNQEEEAREDDWQQVIRVQLTKKTSAMVKVFRYTKLVKQNSSY